MNSILYVERKSGTVYPQVGKSINFQELDLDDPDIIALVIHTDKTMLRLEIQDSGMNLTDEYFMKLGEMDEEIERRRASFKVIRGKTNS